MNVVDVDGVEVAEVSGGEVVDVLASTAAEVVVVARGVAVIEVVSGATLIVSPVVSWPEQAATTNATTNSAQAHFIYRPLA